MNDPVRLDVYRETPAAVPLREREHAPVCPWCKWRWKWGLTCREPRNNPSGNTFDADFWGKYLNNRGQCERYQASWWTRLLQRLGLRPFIERARKWEET